MGAIVLVENETTYEGKYDHWEDLTGVTYHFPNQYRNKVIPGTRFVYYRGVRRNNNQRGQAEYFGIGRIGSVWRDPSVPETDPKGKWRWYCSIEDFVPFPQPVSSKVDGRYLENITNSLGWRTGVRDISDHVLDKITALAGLVNNVSENLDSLVPEAFQLSIPHIDDVVPTEVPGSLNILMGPLNPAREPSAEKSSQSYRRSRQSKKIGDQAEAIAIKWLGGKLSGASLNTITWIAQQGNTPGWDIEFVSENNEMISVEVKGTSGKVFQSIEITAQEWTAAREKRQRFWLVLVTDCLSTNPQVALIQDPYAFFEAGDIEVETILWRLRRSSSESLAH